ncbi:hypothetical protein [Xylella fastidiosa]|uniref:hypothetical protein n=1 Tax=Xylella fastidiosa TaxID=2371 RepID=UPI0015E16E94
MIDMHAINYIPNLDDIGALAILNPCLIAIDGIEREVALLRGPCADTHRRRRCGAYYIAMR